MPYLLVNTLDKALTKYYWLCFQLLIYQWKQRQLIFIVDDVLSDKYKNTKSSNWINE